MSDTVSTRLKPPPHTPSASPRALLTPLSSPAVTGSTASTLAEAVAPAESEAAISADGMAKVVAAVRPHPTLFALFALFARRRPLLHDAISRCSGSDRRQVTNFLTQLVVSHDSRVPNSVPPLSHQCRSLRRDRLPCARTWQGCDVRAVLSLRLWLATLNHEHEVPEAPRVGLQALRWMEPVPHVPARKADVQMASRARYEPRPPPVPPPLGKAPAAREPNVRYASLAPASTWLRFGEFLTS